LDKCNHKTENSLCEHKEVKYCSYCGKVYCVKCGMEWGYDVSIPFINPIPETYTPYPYIVQDPPWHYNKVTCDTNLPQKATVGILTFG